MDQNDICEHAIESFRFFHYFSHTMIAININCWGCWELVLSNNISSVFSILNCITIWFTVPVSHRYGLRMRVRDIFLPLRLDRKTFYNVHKHLLYELWINFDCMHVVPSIPANRCIYVQVINTFYMQIQICLWFSSIFIMHRFFSLFSFVLFRTLWFEGKV